MGQVYMFITCSILPVIIVYLLLAKNIVGGMVTGAVKG
jgi:multiple sugar transport system permease protein